MAHISGTFDCTVTAGPHYEAWLPKDSPRAAVAIVHGVGEHCRRYANLVVPLVDHGYAVYGYDQQGHGKSPGRHGHIISWEDYRHGVRDFLGFVRERQPGLPVFLYGHSMGSLVVLDFILRSPEGLQGAVLSGTAILPAGVGNWVQKLVARLLSRVWPTFTIDLAMDPAALSRDQAVVQAYQEDPLVDTHVSARWGAEAMATREWAASHPELVRLPILFIHGADDPLNLCSGARDFFERIPYPDKEMIVYSGSLHEPHNDFDHARVAEDLAGWLAKKVQVIL